MLQSSHTCYHLVTGLHDTTVQKWLISHLRLLVQVTYGLQKRAKPSAPETNGAGPSREDPLNGLSVTSREWEAARFKQDVESLPEVRIC